MHQSPSISPPPADDQDVYLVLDAFGGTLGRAWRETPEERTDKDSVLADLLDGQFHEPVRVVAFNTKEGWSRDVSRELAEFVVKDCSDALGIPPFLRSFVELNAPRAAQIRLSP